LGVYCNLKQGQVVMGNGDIKGKIVLLPAGFTFFKKKKAMSLG